MKEEQGAAVGELPREESRIRKYFRYLMVVIFLSFIAAVAIGAVMRKFGG